MTSLSDRVEWLRLEAGDSKSTMAKKVGISPASLIGMIKGDSNGMRAVTAFRFVQAYGVRMEWLLFGSGEPFLSPDNQEFPKMAHTVPLIPWDRVGGYKEMSMTEKNAFPQIPSLEGMSKNTFAVTVIGGAMEPKFMEGDTVFVDADKEPTTRCFVFAVHEGRTLLRELVSDGNSRFLVALNKRWPGEEFIPVTENTIILGVVDTKLVKVTTSA